MSFAASIGRFEDLSDKRILGTIRGTASTICESIIRTTPVGKPETWTQPPPPGYKPGRLRGNWYAQLGSPSTDHQKSKLDPTGDNTVLDMRNVVFTMMPDDAMYFANNTPYARRIEYGQHSKQVGPKGMVRVNTTAPVMRGAVKTNVRQQKGAVK